MYVHINVHILSVISVVNYLSVEIATNHIYGYNYILHSSIYVRISTIASIFLKGTYT